MNKLFIIYKSTESYARAFHIQFVYVPAVHVHLTEAVTLHYITVTRDIWKAQDWLTVIHKTTVHL